MSNKISNPRALTAMYRNLKAAREVVQSLRANGIPDDSISILASGEVYPERTYRELDDSFVREGEVQVTEAAETGAAIGGVGGFLIGLSTLLAPGVGPLLVVGGVIGSTLTGAAVGGAAGGAFAVLVDLGLSEKEIESYSIDLKKGKTLVAVRPPADQTELAKQILEQNQPLTIGT